MTMLESIGRIKVGIWQFWRLVTSTNRDLPFHDYFYTNLQTIPIFYPVGENQIEAHGDQKKFFISKSTLIYSTVNAQVVFNNLHNVVIDILAGVWYEFKSNIFSVDVTAASNPGEDDGMYIYFEGVMVDEARRPE